MSTWIPDGKGGMQSAVLITDIVTVPAMLLLAKAGATEFGWNRGFCFLAAIVASLVIIFTARICYVRNALKRQEHE